MIMNSQLTLILGGARSGKSTFAEQLALNSIKKVTYLATAEAKDSEMAARIEIHKRRRPQEWDTLETDPATLPITISSLSGVLLLDCLTMWLTRFFLADDVSENGNEKAWLKREQEIKELTEQLCDAPRNGTHLLVVSNEVGFGLVPPYIMGRRFRDLQGRMNQLCASRADNVVLVVAGCPLWIKGEKKL